MKTLIRLCTAALLLLSGPVFAAVLQYEINGVGSGSLNGVNFVDQAFSFTLVGDTANLQTPSYTAIDPLDSARVTIEGVGTTEFGIATRLGLNGSAVFFSRAGDGALDLLDFYINDTIDLTQAFGPIAGYAAFGLNQFVDVQTSLGLLTFNDAAAITFSAAPVPEPETWGMLLGGLGLTALVRRRRQRLPA